MSNTTSDTVILLTNLKEKVWGDDKVFKEKLEWIDPITEQSHVMEYINFSGYLDAIQVISPTLSYAQFLVREEYRLAMKRFEEDNEYKRGACIMGQPGIGKSCFIAYAVTERLRNKLPVAVQILKGYALFSEGGVTLHPHDDQGSLRLLKDIWAFSDSNEDVLIPAAAFRRTLGVHVFQTTSPRTERWKEWTKQHGVSRYIMDLWSDEEITALAKLLQLDVDRMKDLALKWGQVPRTLLQNFKPEKERLLEATLQGAAFKAIPDCRSILHSIGSLNAPVDSGPSSIFFVRPQETPDGVSRELHAVSIPTPAIQEILANAVDTAAETHRQDFFNALVAFPGTRDAAGIIFETWIHSFLARGNPIQCHWLGKQKDSLPSILCLENGRTVSTKDELRHTTPPFYWRALSNFQGIDGALFVGKYVYAIQITISFSHGDPQAGLEKLRKFLGQPTTKERSWRVLFIGNRPEQSETVSRQFFDKEPKMARGGGTVQNLKGPKLIPVGWCVAGVSNPEKGILTNQAHRPSETDNQMVVD